MSLLELLTEDGFTPIKGGNKHGGEYGSACPACGEGNSASRFRVWPEIDLYWCRICRTHGDSIQYLKAFRSMTFMAACEHLGIQPKEKTVPAARPVKQEWKPRKDEPPKDGWRRMGKRFCKRAEEVLLDGEHQEVMDWLMTERCLNEESIRTFHLGYCPKNLHMARQVWGLDPEKRDDGTEKKVWLPQGIVIPCWHAGDLYRLRIRRLHVSDKEKKYIFISGGNSKPLIANNHSEHTLIVESELDAILVNQEAGHMVNVIALGSVAIRPDEDAHRILTRSKSILLALDSGEDAGPRCAWTWWREHYKHALRCVMVGGKDPTEAMKNGVILKDWIEAALRGGAMRMSA